MKNYLPIIAVAGITVGLLLRGHQIQPERVTISFETDNAYQAPEPTPLAPQAHAQENVNETPQKVAIASPDVNKLVDYIWKAESCRGKCGIKTSLQYYCEQRGEWNELGYGGMAGVNGVKKCFKDKAEGWAFVTGWVERHLDQFKNNEAQTLCTYNIGWDTNEEGKRIPHINCTYYQKYIGAL